MLRYCRRHLALVWFWLLLAALPRALLPAGTMPEFSNGSLQLGYCLSDDGSRLLQPLGDPAPQPESHASCPYALAQALALPTSLPTPLPNLPASTTVARLAPPQPAHVQHPPRPPSQAPPGGIETVC